MRQPTDDFTPIEAIFVAHSLSIEHDERLYLAYTRLERAIRREFRERGIIGLLKPKTGD